MNLLAQIFVENILPILLAAGAGFVLGRRMETDIRTVSRLVFYVFSPCLVFDSLTHSTVSAAELGRIAVATTGVTLASALLALGIGWAMRLERRRLAALAIAATFGNTGNYGLAAVRFAFGDSAMARAVIYYIFSTVGVYTLGVALGGWGKAGWRSAVKQIFALPVGYALLAAGGLRLAGWQIPLPIERTVNLLAAGAIPGLLILLGLQMAQTRDGVALLRAQWPTIGAAIAMQLIAAPLLGLGFARWLGLTGLARQAIVLEAGMPAAVINTVLAAEYELDGRFVAAVVVLSTLLSPFTLTPLIAYLQLGT